MGFTPTDTALGRARSMATRMSWTPEKRREQARRAAFGRWLKDATTVERNVKISAAVMAKMLDRCDADALKEMLECVDRLIILEAGRAKYELSVGRPGGPAIEVGDGLQEGDAEPRGNEAMERALKRSGAVKRKKKEEEEPETVESTATVCGEVSNEAKRQSADSGAKGGSEPGAG